MPVDGASSHRILFGLRYVYISIWNNYTNYANLAILANFWHNESSIRFTNMFVTYWELRDVWPEKKNIKKIVKTKRGLMR